MYRVYDVTGTLIECRTARAKRLIERQVKLSGIRADDAARKSPYRVLGFRKKRRQISSTQHVRIEQDDLSVTARG
jgi:hypothetical protein